MQIRKPEKKVLYLGSNEKKISGREMKKIKERLAEIK